MISVIIPVSNGADFLERCLKSVLAAIDSASDEVLIVNDASLDTTEQICERYAAQYPNTVRCFRMVRTGGPSASRNEGLRHARGNYISFIDSDDYIEPDMLTRLTREAERTGADMALCGYWQEGQGAARRYTAKRAALLSSEDCLKELLDSEIVGNYVWNKLYRREIFDAVQFREGIIYEDIQIMHRIIEQCRTVAVLQECLYHYVKRKGSLTYRPSDEELLLQYRLIQERNRTLLDNHPLLQDSVACNSLKKNIFIYSRLAKTHNWRECRENYRELYEDILRSKHLIRHIPMKYRVLGELIIHAPCLHGMVMYGK